MSDKLQAYNDALLRSLKAAGVKFVRFQTMDVANNPRAKTIPVAHLLGNNKSLEDGIQLAAIVVAGLPSFGDYLQATSGLDARGTLLLEPDLTTLRILPYAPTAGLVLGNLRDLSTGQPSALCGRTLLQSIVQQAKDQHGIGFNVGAELEVTLFDAKTNQTVDVSHFGHVRFLNVMQTFLAGVHDQLEQQEIAVELVHAESGPGQLEIVLRYCNDPVVLADRLVMARETIAACAHAHGFKAVFLPKLNPMKAGSGCHLHLSMFNLVTGQNLFPGDSTSTSTTTTTSSTQSETKTTTTTASSSTTTTTTEAGFELLSPTSNDGQKISPMAQSFLEGILTHFPALLGLTLPTTNSFRRVGPGCWTGSSVSWSYDDKESPLRVAAATPAVMGQPSPGWDHVEYKLCDHTANGYLALAGILACGLDGIAQKATLRPHAFANGDTATAAAEGAPSFPSTVSEALEALRNDSLLKETIPEAMMKGYLAIRNAEAERGKDMSLEDEVKEALEAA